MQIQGSEREGGGGSGKEGWEERGEGGEGEEGII